MATIIGDLVMAMQWIEMDSRSMAIMYVLSGTILITVIIFLVILAQYRRRRLNWLVKYNLVLKKAQYDEKTVYFNDNRSLTTFFFAWFISVSLPGLEFIL